MIDFLYILNKGMYMQNLLRLFFVVTIAGQISASDYYQNKESKFQNRQNKKELAQQRNFDRRQKEVAQDWYDPRNKTVRLAYLAIVSGKNN